MDFIRWETVLGAVLGSGVTSAIARYFILKALNDLEKISEHVHNINAKLSAIEVKLGQLEKLEETAISHDRQITEIQSRFKYERSASGHSVTDQARVRPT